MGIRLISKSPYRGPSLGDAGGLLPLGRDVLARLDFENDIYRIGAMPAGLADVLIQTQGGIAFQYNPVTDAIETLPSGEPVRWTPAGRKAVWPGQAFTAVMGEYRPVAGTRAFAMPSAEGGQAHMLAVQGRRGQVRIECAILGLDVTCRAGEIVQFTPATYPTGTSSAQWVVTVSEGVVNWHCSRTNYVIGTNRGSEIYDRRAYAFGDAVRGVIAADRTLVFAKTNDVPSGASRPFMELLSAAGGFAMNTSGRSTNILPVNGATNGATMANRLVDAGDDETWAIAIDGAAGQLRFAVNGRRFAEAPIAAGAFVPTIFTFGAVTRMTSHNQAGGSGLRQMAVLSGAASGDELREISRSFS